MVLGPLALGAEPAIVLLATDLTERKAMEKEVGRINLFLDSIVENIPDMIFVKRASDLAFVRFNRAGEDLLGRERRVANPVGHIEGANRVARVVDEGDLDGQVWVRSGRRSRLP